MFIWIFYGWLFIDAIKKGYWDAEGILVFPALFLLTFIATFFISYVMFYIGYKIALNYNNRIVVAESNVVTNDTKEVETISTDSADTSVKK